MRFIALLVGLILSLNALASYGTYTIDATQMQLGDDGLLISQSEFNKLDGATENIQSSLDLKATKVELALKADDSAVVHKTGNETVAGVKSFSGKIQATSTTNGNSPCPSFTETARDAIVSPAAGDCVFNTTAKALNVHDGTTWKVAGGGISDWATSVAYLAGDVVIQNGSIFRAVSAHTSTTFSTDLAGGKWLELTNSAAVIGGTSSTDNAIARYDGTTGKLVQNSLATVSDTGEIGASNIYAPSPSTTSVLSGVNFNNKTVFTSGTDGLTLKGGSAGDSSVLIQGTLIPNRDVLWSVGNNSTNGANVTLTGLNNKYIRLTSSSLLSVGGIETPSGTGAKEHSFYNSTGNSITFLHNSSPSTGSPLDLGGVGAITLQDGKKIEFSWNSVSGKWVTNHQSVWQANAQNNGAWSACETLVVNATTTAPTKGAASSDCVKWRQVGEDVEVDYTYAQSAGAAGSGEYLYRLPTGIEFADSVAKYTGGWNHDANNRYNVQIEGSASHQNANSSMFTGVVPYDSNRFRMGIFYSGASSGVCFPASSSCWQMNYAQTLNLRLKFQAKVNGKALTATTPIVSQNTYSIRAGQTIRGGWSTCPAGTVERDGRSLSIAKWPELYAALGTKHGNGSTAPAGVANDAGCPAASGCFNIADARGRLDRHIDGGTGRDENAAARTAMATGGNAGNAVGSVEVDEIKAHTHRQSGNSNPFGSEGASVAGNGGFAGTVTGVPALTETRGGLENQVDTAYDMSCVQLESTNITARTQQVAYLKDYQPNNTVGGAIVANTWTKRTLNTIEGDTFFVTLSNSQFALPAGTYEIEASAPFYMTGTTRLALRDITNSTTPILGESEYCELADGSEYQPNQIRARLSGRIVINSPTTYELQYNAQTPNGGTSGLGYASNKGIVELFSVVKITKY